MLFLVDELPPDGPFRLDGLRGARAARARTRRPGQELLLGNGRGETATAVVTAVSGARLDLVVTGRAVAPRPCPELVVVQGVADRDELAVAALTELGADEIAPLVPAQVADRWWRRDPTPNWRRVASDAAERSGRVWVPRIGAVYRSVLRRFEWGACGFVLDQAATEPLSTVDIPEGGELVLVVGASDEERAALAGTHAVRVRLDAPTAGARDTAIAAAAVLAARLRRRVSGPGAV